MSTKRKIWIDMTDLQVWSGHMTGVQRVVYQNAVRFAGSAHYDAAFFAFDDSRNVFVEVSFEGIKARVEAAMSEVPQGGITQSGSRLKRIPRALLRRVPPSVKQKVPGPAKVALKRGARLSVRILRKGHAVIGRRIQPAADSRPTAQFATQDIVLVMGKPWDFPALMPALGNLKQEKGFKLVHLVHDMIPTLEPHLFGPGLFEPYTKCMFEVCTLSDKILTNSESTKRDVIRFCKLVAISPPPVSAVRLGDDLLDFELDPDMPPPDPRIKGDFILQVGTIELRKNHLLTYLAYREAALRGIDMPMWVIMGSQGWLVGDLLHQLRHDPLVKDKVVILMGHPDTDRLWLYNNCRFTVYPSIYEGWGMPVSESLAYGKACITSTTASLPEAGGSFAHTVSPYNSQQMLEAILAYMDDKKLAAREKTIKEGYKPASWDDTFAQIDKQLQSL